MFFMTNWRLPYFEDASNMLVDVTFDWKRGWEIVNQKNKKIAFTAIRKRNSWISKTERKKCKNTQNILLDGYYLLLDYLVSAKKIGSYSETVQPRNRPELSTQKSFAWIIKQWIRLSYDVKIRIVLISEARSLALICRILHIILISLILSITWYLIFLNNSNCNKQ